MMPKYQKLREIISLLLIMSDILDAKIKQK